jgi:hypothetical protein
MVLTVSFALSLVTGLSCHHRKRNAQALSPLDASVGASGPHDFAVRVSIIRRARLRAPDAARVHCIPFPTFVTIAKRPSCENETPLIYRCFYLFAKRNIFQSGAGQRDEKIDVDLPVGQNGRKGSDEGASYNATTLHVENDSCDLTAPHGRLRFYR